MKMPKLQPFAIKTQKFSFYSKFWRLLFKKRQWQLIEDWHYTLPNKRIVIIPKGFIFDGSSYPAIVWLFFSPTGLLLIPVILHDFCFEYNYLWAKQDDKIFKFKEGYGFLKWSTLIRKVGIERNELLLIDYFIWVLCMAFGWVNWLTFQRKTKPTLLPEDK
ncbi:MULTISPECIES: DUF1353 domain-containing protein [unclassified Colwellia]|uniref:DUF1353 domain-containing protein n=1 Tax=unclassified Colwellia TaxID=196834 RepID=UPI0015F60B53|nr:MULTISPECIES: DUF1353 domain-containing protein [unclassified Colwellia]MBA6357600.1 DUF1353 domain-containing protein [Colwellia sp. BRX8-3]MBA6361396.1 DUF1353 domain-containing protein [Colwellia sp. BRX8-6]MBA6369313.1 DUF1353 domain-containing protein [Colwellia sp. BRX8-5]MBA6375761.1 DUF1353 domain-containing protein [Colwellia sp. BRX8-2]